MDDGVGPWLRLAVLVAVGIVLFAQRCPPPRIPFLSAAGAPAATETVPRTP